MLAFNLKLSRQQQTELEKQLALVEAKGDWLEVKRLLALLSFMAGQCMEDIAEVLRISIETIRQSIHRFLLGGIAGIRSKRRPGRPSKMTKAQRKKLSKWMEEGPEKSGFSGCCWRTPMVQH